MKKILFFTFLVLVGCGKKNEDEGATCQVNKYQTQCSTYLTDVESNITLPSYPGCVAAFKYGADGKGTGKLLVVPDISSSSIQQIQQSRRVRLFENGKILKEEANFYMNLFEIEENKEYTVTCDTLYTIGMKQP